VSGDAGRDAFEAATGVPAMAFGRRAGRTDGTVDRSLAGGSCPAADGEEAHAVAFCLAFGQEQTEAAGGRYAEGDVIHAHAECTCGTAYADRWLAGEKSAD